MDKWVKTMHNKKEVEKERLGFNLNITKDDALYQFVLELQPTNINSYQLNELVKCYKDLSKPKQDREDVKLEIFRACFKMLYFYSYKNTYTKKTYNDGDMIFGMWKAFEYLLDKFEFKAYKDENGVNNGGVLSFRNYLKKFYGAKFHRFNYQSSKLGTTPLSDLIWKSHNKVSSDSYDRLLENNFEIKKYDKDIIEIDYSDSIDELKEELIQLVNDSLSPVQAEFVLHKFKLSKNKKRFRYNREKYNYENVLTVALAILSKNNRIKEIFNTIKEYNSLKKK